MSKFSATRSNNSTFSISHNTTGLDIFVSSQRVIVLDFPALMSPGVMDNTGRDSNKHSAHLTLSQSVWVIKNLYFKHCLG